MTTTLRPTGPEETRPGGGRAREFAVRVNGRAAGRTTLSTHPVLGPAVGVIGALEIEEPDRGRGRGAVAALAAEEVLRGWGCRRVTAEVPAGAGAALRLAASLGYRETNRGMTKSLAGPPPRLPAGSATRPMTAREFEPWNERARTDYLHRWTAQGLAPERAAEVTASSYAALLPDGHATLGTALRVLVHEGAEVGWIWVRTGPSEGREQPWVFLVEVGAGHRGSGHGRSLMLAAEAECLAAGATTLGLNVFTDNEPAMRLYASLGYLPHAHVLAKPLV